MSDENAARRSNDEAPGMSDRAAPRTPELPTQEKHQPDPLLQISAGRMGAGGVTLVALGIALILGFVFWGLNSRVEPGNPATARAHTAQGAMASNAIGKSGAAVSGKPPR